MHIPVRIRKTVAAAAISALPVLAFAAPAAHASAARPVGGGPVPAPLVQYCAAGETQVQFLDNNDRAVAQWSASHNFFLEETANHTPLCQKNEHTINGVQYWEYAAVLNGHETNDCVSLKNGASKPVGLNGCSAGTNYLLWADIVNCNGINEPPECIAADYTGDWIDFAGSYGQPLQVHSPQADDTYWWFVTGG